MKSATIRDVQHNLSKVLLWIQSGEEVIITRRNIPIARMNHPNNINILFPNFAKRAKQIIKIPKGKLLSNIILEDR